MIAVILATLLTQTPPPEPQWVTASGDETTAAVVMYGQGQSLSVLCRDARLELLVGGLSATAEPTRTLQVNLKGPELKDSTWITGADQTTAISTASGVYARHFRRGGVFIVRVPPENGARGRRYELPLPSDSTALDRVLTACDQPLERAEDAAYNPTKPLLRWRRIGAPRFPRDTDAREGAAVLTCVAEMDGDLRDCRVDAETPRFQGFGREALAGTQEAQLESIDGKPIGQDQEITFTVRFRVD